MTIILFVMIIAAAAATLFVLVKGLIGMAKGGGDINAARSQVLMQKRVTYQAIAILFVVLFIMVGRSA
jgi:hypothetical protein